MNVYGTTSDTIIQCFCMDEEMHDGAKFAPKSLKDFIHRNLPKANALLENDESLELSGSAIKDYQVGL